MTEARCEDCRRRLRWGESRDHGGQVTYCPIHTPHRVTQPIAITVEAEWTELGGGRLTPGLERLLPDADDDGGERDA